MDLELFCINNNPGKFFEILPEDWQQIIVPNWKNFKNTSYIYVFKNNDNIIAGGIIFTKNHPSMSSFEKENDYLYSENYHYLGFIWVVPEKRNQKLASKWLNALKTKKPNQKYWLTIEEEQLKGFYEKNDFKIIRESNDFPKEWIFTYTP